MKKSLLSLLVLSVIGASTYALLSPGLFPDTSEFPRVPSSPGTVGGAISRLVGGVPLESYSGDGTTPDTRALSGRTSTGYLRAMNPCSGSQKYIGVDANGLPRCGNTTILLAEYGKVEAQSCDADYYRADGTSGKTSIGGTLRGGDIIKTAPGCTLAIVFPDYSILRLDGDTTVSLDIETLPDDTTIASAILTNGSLWGRILTETGSYRIGGDDIAAGIRGTSIYVKKPGYSSITSEASQDKPWRINTLGGTPYPTELTVLHTTKNDNEVLCTDRVATIFSTGTINSLICNNSSGLATPSISSLYSGYPRLAANTREDIVYMSRLGSSSAIPSAKRAKINNELTITEPISYEDKASLCGPGKKYWISLNGTPFERCQDKDTRAIANFRITNNQIYTESNIISVIGLNNYDISSIVTSPYKIEYEGINVGGTFQVLDNIIDQNILSESSNLNDNFIGQTGNALTIDGASTNFTLRIYD